MHLLGGDFADPRLCAIFDAIVARYRDGQPSDLVGLYDDLDDDEGTLARIGGVATLAELADAAESGVLAESHARRVRRLALERRARLLHERAAAAPLDSAALAELNEIATKIDLLVGGSMLRSSFTADRLREVLAERQPDSPLPRVLDTEPTLHVLAALPKSGKTCFALSIAASWGLGIAPWTGAPRLPGTRVLVVSAEQAVRRIAHTARQLAHAAPGPSREGWEDRVVIVARDRALDPSLRPLLRLDETGVAALRGLIEESRRAGDPIGFVVLDSLSRLKPGDVEENDADAMSAWLDSLAAIATDMNVYVLLIHHAGHAARANPVSTPRGSSAIAAVAQVVLNIETPAGRSWERTLRVDGNNIESASTTFRVSDDGDAGRVLFFQPADPAGDADIETLLPVGSQVSVNGLALKMMAEDGMKADHPSGSAKRRAREVASAWKSAGLVAIDEPARRGHAALIRRLT